jgi:CMP-N,N'-diacetyllegionaminic acid synthase
MFKGKSVLVVIPARSGSKSIKNKNILKINRKPLINYSIEYAKKSKIVDNIIVSTDSKKYLNLIRKYKLTIPFLRKKLLSGHNTPDYPVIKDALLRCEKHFNKIFDIIIILRPTSPFRERNLIEKSIKLLINNKFCTSVRAMQKTDKHPYRHWITLKKKKFVKSVISNISEPYNLPRQKLPVCYFQTGDIETIKRNTILSGSVSGSKVLPLIIKNPFLDIDELEDLKKIKYF